MHRITQRQIQHHLKRTLIAFLLMAAMISAQTYKIVDTGQSACYDNQDAISTPSEGEAFYGQDAQYDGFQPVYTDNGDGTITDNITGLMWSKTPDLDGDGLINYADKLSHSEALAGADTFSLAGYDDWRLPTIKEQYSLIMFSGVDPSGWNGTDVSELTPFINTDYFDFGYGDTAADERIIDAQFATSTQYVSTTMMGDSTMFGVNFADGRIKGYPVGPMPGQTEDKQFYVLYVRGNPDYGVNDFVDNGDGTITDNATGLMWQQTDSDTALTWEAAFEWVQQKNADSYLGYNDWRLPNVKELQSIVDYTRSPVTTNSAAIDTLFECSQITDEDGSPNYPFYWSSTTHNNMNHGDHAAYVSFGEALGWMEVPPMSGNYQLLDVHGAGAQRSDPKTGDPNDYPYGFGPQGDVIRIYNDVRLVRNAETQSGLNERTSGSVMTPVQIQLQQNYPNPFNPTTTITFTIPKEEQASLAIYDLLGHQVRILTQKTFSAGDYTLIWNGQDDIGLPVASGIYVIILSTGEQRVSRKMMLVK